MVVLDEARHRPRAHRRSNPFSARWSLSAWVSSRRPSFVELFLELDEELVTTRRMTSCVSAAKEIVHPAGCGTQA